MIICARVKNSSETYLTTLNVTPSAFGKIRFIPTDGRVDAQPLYLADVPVLGQGNHNVVYIVTEHDSVYAVDADTQALLWQATALGAGETASDDRQCPSAITPEIGISSTPVIDRGHGTNGAIYLVAATEAQVTTFIIDSRSRRHQRSRIIWRTDRNQAQFPGAGLGAERCECSVDGAIL